MRVMTWSTSSDPGPVKRAITHLALIHVFQEIVHLPDKLASAKTLLTITIRMAPKDSLWLECSQTGQERR
jgi:hypothetical protein